MVGRMKTCTSLAIKLETNQRRRASVTQVSDNSVKKCIVKKEKEKKTGGGTGQRHVEWRDDHKNKESEAKVKSERTPMAKGEKCNQLNQLTTSNSFLERILGCCINFESFLCYSFVPICVVQCVNT